MYVHTTAYRVIYADTDQMGFMYYANYARLFEIGRVELMRSLGMSYKEIEYQGLILPVASCEAKFIQSVYYDDLLSITTTLLSFPDRYRVTFFHKIYNEAKNFLAKGKVTLYVLNAKDKKPAHFPHRFLHALKQYF